MTDEEIKKHKKAIDGMSREDMARLRRFAHAGHIYFRKDLPLTEYFEKRFQSLGGMSPAISKRIGWMIEK